MQSNSPITDRAVTSVRAHAARRCSIEESMRIARSCSPPRTPLEEDTMQSTSRLALIASTLLLGLAGSATAGNTNGVAGAMPAYYDDELFVINFKELPPDAEQA